jgi:pilus assembly protein CpaF
MSEDTLYMTLPKHAEDRPEAARTSLVLTPAARHSIKNSVHNELLRRTDLQQLLSLKAEDSAGRARLLTLILQLVGTTNIPLSTIERDRLAQEVLDEVFGLGPLEPLLQDPTVSDIMVNTHRNVFVERRGLLEKTDFAFRDNAHLMHIIEKIVSAVGRRIDESSPMVDARLLDGSRVNIIIPPLAIDGPILSIRRFGHKSLTGQDLVSHQSMTMQMLAVLEAAVRARLNIVVSGGTGAGKTTLLNVLSSFISPRERIVTIEDSAELQIKQEHVVRLECRPSNIEGTGAIKQRELLINALRMRPDRIIVGEVRSEEALDMLQAMNTGHDGSLTTVHANTPRDAISRIETMSMMGNVKLPEKAIRTQIASAVDVIVQVSRMSDGVRRITHISEITGMSGEVISMQDLFVFQKKGLTSDGKVLGSFASTGIVPAFAERLTAAGFSLPQGVVQ